MDKTCKRILDHMISLGVTSKCSLSQGNSRIGFDYSLGELAVDKHLDVRVARKAVDYLVSTGYADYINGGTARGTEKSIAFQLTHKGIHWREFRRAEILDYIADKWLDVLSSLIAVASLIVSIIALWQVK